jgi:hypothetical protein
VHEAVQEDKIVGPAAGGDRVGAESREMSWKVPLALWIAGFVAKVVLSLAVSDAVGSWVGGALGFLALVTTVLWARTGTRGQVSGRRASPDA